MNAATKKSPIARINSFGEELPPLMDPTLFSSVGPELSYVDNDGSLAYGLPSINQQVGIFDPQQTSDFYSQIQTATYSSPPNLSSVGYLYQDLSAMRTLGRTSSTSAPGMMMQCEAAQFSSHSMLSQDTGLSTDRNTEITSVASKHNIGITGACDGVEDQDERVIDIEMWK